MHVVLLCHTQVKKREVPDEFGAFDRWILKMEKKTAAKTIEWARNILFLNFKIMVVEDAKTKTKKGQGGERYIYASQHPCWDAKTRSNLPDEMRFDKGVLPEPLAKLFLPMGRAATTPPVVSTPAAATEPAPAASAPVVKRELDMPHHRKLWALMEQAEIELADLMQAIAAQGHFPADTPFENLPEDYVSKALLPNWGKVVDSIKKESQPNAA